MKPTKLNMEYTICSKRIELCKHKLYVVIPIVQVTSWHCSGRFYLWSKKSQSYEIVLRSPDFLRNFGLGY